VLVLREIPHQLNLIGAGFIAVGGTKIELAVAKPFASNKEIST